jgi:hypothetical protein
MWIDVLLIQSLNIERQESRDKSQGNNKKFGACAGNHLILVPVLLEQ